MLLLLQDVSCQSGMLLFKQTFRSCDENAIKANEIAILKEKTKSEEEDMAIKLHIICLK